MALAGGGATPAEPEKALFPAPGARGLGTVNESLASLPKSEERSKDSAKSQAESSNNKTDPLCAGKTGVSPELRAKIAKHGCTNNKDKAKK
jgi:hypothetical protein